MDITTPLPQRYLTDAPGLGGTIKVRPEDFVVEELPLYEPSGEGEHLYLRICKTGVGHAELLSCLRRVFDLPSKSIGFAGMKDKHAVTTQTVSLHLREDPPALDLGHERITVLWAQRHRNKIKRGHLTGNRFALRIRDVDPLKAPTALRTLRELEQTGFPAYFGPQRFGYRVNNHVLGQHVLTGQWQTFLDELLGTGGAPFPEYQRERREMYDQGQYAEAAAQWTRADRAELVASRALAEGRTPARAAHAVGGATLGFHTSATLSAAFNRVVDQRIEHGTLGTLMEGDLAWLHGKRAVFPVTAEELASGTLPDRLAQLELSPSGPLWGPKMTHAAGTIAGIEDEALQMTGVTEEMLNSSRYAPHGQRRPLRCPISNLGIEGGFDEHGPYLDVRFDLPRGMYGTVVLRELMKNDAVGPTFT